MQGFSRRTCVLPCVDMPAAMLTRSATHMAQDDVGNKFPSLIVSGSPCSVPEGVCAQVSSHSSAISCWSTRGWVLTVSTQTLAKLIVYGLCNYNQGVIQTCIHVGRALAVSQPASQLQASALMPHISQLARPQRTEMMLAECDETATSVSASPYARSLLHVCTNAVAMASTDNHFRQPESCLPGIFRAPLAAMHQDARNSVIFAACSSVHSVLVWQ